MAIAKGNSALWADINSLYTSLRAKQSNRGVTQTTIPTASAGTSILLTHANTLRTAINNLSPPVAVPAAASVGTLIAADYLNGLKASLDSVPNRLYLFKNGTFTGTKVDTSPTSYELTITDGTTTWKTTNIDPSQVIGFYKQNNLDTIRIWGLHMGISTSTLPYIGIETNNKINLTPYSSLVVKASFATGEPDYFQAKGTIGYRTTKDGTVFSQRQSDVAIGDCTATQNNTTQIVTTTLNISNINSSVYLDLGMRNAYWGLAFYEIYIQ